LLTFSRCWPSSGKGAGRADQLCQTRTSCALILAGALLLPGFDEAAASLGVSTQTLMAALGAPRGGRPDLAAAAARLGITESELRVALPPPGR
jgi:hypothetical protein|tara:strand:+ start:2833 stop:3111 length:279 start_codon:yes stop_codon:yes gene_type:complete